MLRSPITANKATFNPTLTLTTLSSLLLCACATTTSSINQDHPTSNTVATKAANAQANSQLPSNSATIAINNSAFLPVTLKPKSTSQKTTPWLSSITINLNMGSAPIPLSEILRKLSSEGINIVSEMPLDKYTYAGFSLKNISADTALRTILAGSSLDYSVDPIAKLVTIKPLSSKTWYLNTGNKTSEYSSNSGSSSSSTQLKSSGSSSISSKDDFWASLKTELEQRTQINVQSNPQKTQSTPSVATLLSPNPTPLLPPPITTTPSTTTPSTKTTTSSTSQSSSNDSMKTEKISIATYSLNPETGAVSVQGPSWLLDDIDAYMKKIQSQYNTNLTFEGELLILNTDSASSEGINMASFSTFASSRYGIALNSNSSGAGYTFSVPKFNLTAAERATGTTMDLSMIPGIASSGLSAPALGLVSVLDGLQLFNNYLSTQGKVTALQKPVITTTSGSPVDFRKTIVRYYNTVSQNSSSSTTSSSVATQNNLIAQEFGTILRVNPRYDPSTGLVRAQIELTQTTQAGNQTISQSISSGNSVSQVATSVPIASKVLYSGEALMLDGDTLIMGGQSDEQLNSNRSGITGLMDTPIASPITSNVQQDQSKNIFYFAIKLKINKK